MSAVFCNFIENTKMNNYNECIYHKIKQKTAKKSSDINVGDLTKEVLGHFSVRYEM
jgi:hypothetical protein